MKAAITPFLVVSLIGLGSCAASISKLTSVNGYKLTVNYPVVRDSGTLINLKDTVPIFYYGSYVIYQLPYNYSQQLDDKLVVAEKRYHSFIFRENEKYGYLYSDYSDTTRGVRAPVDSILSKRGYSLELNADSLILTDVLENKETGTIIEKYVLPGEKTDFTIDSIYYYYNRAYNQYEYSFSKKLDSSRGMKLYKARFLYKDKFSVAYHIILPERELNYAVGKMTIENENEIIRFVKRYESGHPKAKGGSG